MLDRLPSRTLVMAPGSNVPMTTQAHRRSTSVATRVSSVSVTPELSAAKDCAFEAAQVM